MQLIKQNHSARKQRALTLWLEMAQLYNEGVPVIQIAKRYINPNTGKYYTREGVYFALKKLRDFENLNN